MPYIVSVGYEITPPVLRISAALFISLSCGLSGFICISVAASLRNILQQEPVELRMNLLRKSHFGQIPR